MIKELSGYLIAKWKRIIKPTSDKSGTDAIVKIIESEKGAVGPEQYKLCEEYAEDVFGWIGYAKWLKVYTAIQGEFKEGWIPDNYYGKHVVPKINRSYGRISGMRPLASQLVNAEGMPDLLYLVNGMYYSRLWEYIPPEKVKDVLFSENDIIVFKASGSLQGRGVKVLTSAEFDVNEMQSARNGVFQAFIKQHDWFNVFMPYSVVTLRVTSVLERTGCVSCRAAYLRIGRSDDTHVQSANAIKVSTDLNTGQLHETGYLPNWSSVHCHPDTKTVFKDRVVPKFSECLKFAERLHKGLPYCQSIGWDLAIGQSEEIFLMEWNGGHNDIKFSEATTGPCFADLGWEKMHLDR